MAGGKAEKKSRGSGRRKGLGRLLHSPLTPIVLVVLIVAALAASSWPSLSAAFSSILAGLGVGLLLLAVWLVLAVFLAAKRPKTLRTRWRLLLAALPAGVAALGFLSWFSQSSESSLGGSLGWAVGRPAALGVVLTALLVVAASAIVSLKWTLRALKRAGRALWAVARFAGLGAVAVGGAFYALGRRVFALVTGRKLETAPRPPKPARSKRKKKQEEPAVPEPPDATGAARVRGAVMPDGWKLPSTEALQKPSTPSGEEADLDSIAQTIEETLADHGVSVAVSSVRAGPRVIQFGLSPGWVNKGQEEPAKNGKPKAPPPMSRVRVDQIMARERDLALALRATAIRMEAPVPGEAFVGVEVPNPNPRMVTIRAIVESHPFKAVVQKGGLAVALGADTGGDPVAVDLRAMPHMLIAGATGSGKSVCINTLLVSLIITRTPSDMRLMLVDPKRVEMNLYNGTPHLLCPVIVDVQHVVKALRCVVQEMDRRYRLLEQAKVRNLEAYQKLTGEHEHLPYLVVVVDELADLMMAAGDEVEAALVRLAQLGRASGIHLVVATQRPSVNVVTGLLKANIPARAAFAVASQVDSRVILDGAGAEKLLGKGDMLLLSHDSPKARRVQGCFVSDAEIERLVNFWRAQQRPDLPKLTLEGAIERVLDSSGEGDGDGQEDTLLAEARKIASKSSSVSAPMLQRKLRIGYARAVNLLDQLEAEGAILGGDPGKSRTVIAVEDDERA